MSTIDIKKGDSLLTLAGTAILTTYTAGSSFQAGAAGVVGLQLWITIVTDAASSINTVTFAIETSNDALTYAPTLAIPHVGAGTQDVEPSFGGLAVGTTYLRRISVPPQYIGTAKYVRLKAKANAAGVGTDAIGVVGTGW